MGNMKRCNYVIAGVTGCLGMGIMILSGRLSLKFTASGPGAGFWPMMLGGVFIITAICLLVTTIVRREELEKNPVVLLTNANKRVYLIMGIIVVYCLLLNIVGFYIASFLFIPVVMYIMDERDKKKITLTTLISVAVIYIVFGILLNIKMPTSMFY